MQLTECAHFDPAGTKEDCTMVIIYQRLSVGQDRCRGFWTEGQEVIRWKGYP
jgi:hypothetical protein